MAVLFMARQKRKVAWSWTLGRQDKTYDNNRTYTATSDLTCQLDCRAHVLPGGQPLAGTG
jgi:hypothetical protein